MTKPSTPETNRKEGQKNEKRMVAYQERFSGPLPHPKILEHYNSIVPGAGNRIIKKFESQTEHRQKIESKVITSDSIKSIGGLVAGFIIAMTTILGGIYTALQGMTFLGGSLSFTGLALVVGSFITRNFISGKKSSKRD